jgi:hypothetical protein
VVALAFAVPAAADPLRLRGDALAIAPSPAGLLMLEAEGDAASWLSAEAVVWFGNAPARDDEASGDALVIAVRARAGDRASVRLGRFVATAGALRPTHLDGAAGRVRLPYRFDAELFAGVPVSPDGARMWDWTAGGRVSRRLGDWGSVGIAVLERREEGRRSAQELGVDAGGAIGKHGDAAARLAIDLLTSSIAEVAVTGSRKLGAWRLQVRAGQRAPSHLVPATSLFSVLGDVPSQSAGAAVTWRAAPRLDVVADAGARRVDGAIEPDITLRANLRLDDRGAGVIGGELRRAGGMDTGWFGARATARVPLRAGLAFAAEVELVRPDDDANGAWWPWALAAVSGRRGGWDAAIAVEASASAEYRHRVDVLAQLGRRWDGP